MPDTSRPSCTSSQEFQHLVMDLAVRAQELARIDRSLAAKIRRAPARFFHNNTQWSQVPRLRRPIERRFNGTLGDEHVLPEASKRSRVSRGVQQSPNSGLDRKSTRLNSSHTVISYA